MPLKLKPGKKIKRTALHRQLGGRKQGGISPSAQSPNVFLFTDQTRGVQHGYIYDGQRPDGLYDYTGEGQSGDQQMIQGNRAIRDHQEEGRELHLFDSHKGMATYLGQFKYVKHHTADAPQKGSGDERSVIVFRLKPIGETGELPRSPIDQLSHIRQKEVPVEQHLTEQIVIEPKGKPYEAKRREQKLVRELMDSLTAEGHEVCRLQLWPKGEPAPFRCDLFDRTTNTLVEAKSSIARPAFRMAIGQLADYARLVKPPVSEKAILLPEKPRPDLLKLAKGEGISVIWPNGKGDFTARRPASP